MKFRFNQLVFCFVLLVAPILTFAEEFTSSSNRVVEGKDTFTLCAFCHGMQAQGGQTLDAPPLAGMEAWYIERQLIAFRDLKRGMHDEDVPGLQMSIVSNMTRNEETLKNIAAYLQSLPPGAPPEKARNGEEAGTERPFLWQSKYASLNPPRPADTTKGAAIYKASCVACHGAGAEGNQALGAPKLTDLPDWYQNRQLQYYRDGIRGTAAEGAYAIQMAAFGKLLKTDQEIADVTAYILSLGGSK